MASDLPTSIDKPQLRSIAVIGAGNGGKAVAADLALQGRSVRLFEWAEYRGNVTALLHEPVIEAEGEINGQARLDCVTCDLPEALEGVDLIVACVQGTAHARLAHELAPLLWDGAVVLLNPGSCGGALEVRRILAEHRLDRYVLLGETSTLTHCARAVGERKVRVALRVRRVLFAALPGAATEGLAHELRRHFPGIVPARDVLEVALSNGNPVIHPAIMLMNLGAIETQGQGHRFYAQGVTEGVAQVIAAVDAERLALGRALGCDLLAEPEMSVAQGYATSTDYCACYRDSEVFAPLTSPAGPDHRYLHEDVGLGLVTYVSLGEMLGVPTPVSRALMTLATTVTGRDYLAEGRRTAESLGIAGMNAEEREAFLQEARRV